MEDAIMVHKNELVYYDRKGTVNKHMRYNAENIKGILFEYRELKRWFGLRKELVEVIVITVDDRDTPIEIWEHKEENFRRYMGRLRTFVDENKVPLEIRRPD